MILDIDPSTFTNVEGQADTGVVIDTGSIFNSLADDAYDVVSQIVANLLDPVFKRKRNCATRDM